MASTTHTCPGGCGEQIQRHLFACHTDWFRLPYAIRKAISTHHRRNPGAHFSAMSDAIAWYRQHPKPSRPEVIA